MCVYSMVMDHFQPIIPQTIPSPLPNGEGNALSWTSGSLFTLATQKDIEELKAQISKIEKLLIDFHTAAKAAKTVDILTSQPDCEDPEKKKLENRVANLEKQIKQLKARIKPFALKNKPEDL